MPTLRQASTTALVLGIWVPILSVTAVVCGTALTIMYVKSCWKLDWFPEK